MGQCAFADFALGLRLLHTSRRPYTESWRMHLQGVVCTEPPPAGLIGGPALSDCISGPAGIQHGLNTQERDGIG